MVSVAIVKYYTLDTLQRIEVMSLGVQEVQEYRVSVGPLVRVCLLHPNTMKATHAESERMCQLVSPFLL